MSQYTSDPGDVTPPDAEEIRRSITAAISERAPTVTRPTANPCTVYPPVPGIDCNLFQLGSEGVLPAQRAQALAQLEAYETVQRSNFLGYQANQRLDFAGTYARYLDYHVNNISDPFQSGNFTVNSKWMERAVLDYFAALWNAKWPYDATDPESYWGYVLTMGSSEGNLYGIWNARDYLAGKFLMDDPPAQEEARKASLDGEPRSVPNRMVYAQATAPAESPHAYTPIAFYSEDAHYSIIKAMRVLDIRTFYEIGSRDYPDQNPLAPGKPWPQEVPSTRVPSGDGPGTIDVEALAKLVEFFASKGYPILVVFNYGTAYKGAYDDVEAAGNRLMPILKRYGLDERTVHYDPKNPDATDVRTGYWFHVDGALGAAFMPFVEMAYEAGQMKERGPNFDFRLPFVHSISMSGHKWIGAPWPMGLYMTKVKMQLLPPDSPEYIGAADTTFAGSRNGFSAMILWDYLARRSYVDEIQKAVYTERMAAFVHAQLLRLEMQLGQDLWVERSPLSLTVRFKAVNPKLVFKYSLSGETLMVNGQQREYNHVFMMDHVTPELIDRFIIDLGQPGAFREPSPQPAANAAPAAAAPDARRLMHVPRSGRGFSG